jgi:hypothetical protein
MSKPRSRRGQRRVVARAATALAIVAGLAAAGVQAASASSPAGADHASRPAGVTALINEYMAAKSSHNPDRTMAFFDKKNTTYVDGTLGWEFPNWDALNALFDKYMPQWPAGARSYQTEVLGNAQGAVVLFTNTPQEFGHEIRGIAVVDIRHGKFVRWVDYWDGRHFGVAATESLRTPASQFPSDFGESKAGNSAGPVMNRIAGELSADFAQDHSEQAAGLFAPDAVLTDLTLHTTVVGRQSITSYLARALPTLPYGRGARVRHIVGGPAGGGYEWTNTHGPVPRGVTAIKLNSKGQIVQLTSIWDGSLVTPACLTQEMSLTIEG